MPPIDRLLEGARRKLEGSGRPLVTLSYAQSLDGSVSIRRGQPTAISGAGSLQMTHKLRAAHDAILVGVGTVLADDPQLTVRLVEGENPIVVILDSELRTPTSARALATGSDALVFCAQTANEDAEAALSSQGVEVIRISHNESGLDLNEMLTELGSRGIASLMVEGGAGVISAFLKSGMVDQVVLTIAPRFIGGLKAIESLLAVTGEDFPTLEDMQVEMLGEDLVLWGGLKAGHE